jgi:hypothetical protein
MPYPVYLLLWFTIAIPAFVGMAVYKRLPASTRWIVVLMCFGFVVEILLRLMAHISSNNIYIINIYTCIETLLLTLYFADTVSGLPAKRIVKVVGFSTFFLPVLEMLFGGIYIWVSYSSSLESLIFITIGLYYFYEVASSVNPDSPSQSANFWITGVIVYYFMSSLEYFLLNRFLVKVSERDLMMLGNIHTFVNAFCNVTYGLILWKFTRSYSLAQY